jgi:hypothetical protein
MPIASSSLPLAPSAAIERIQRIGRLGRILAVSAIVLAVAGTAWVWTDASLVEKTARTQLGLGDRPFTLTTRTWLLAFVLSFVPIGLFIYGMANVAGLFGCFANGRVFVTRNASYLARIGWTFIAMGLAAIPLRPLIDLALTLDNEPGPRSVSLALDLEMLAHGVIGAGLLAIATVVREAVRLHDENQQFV